MVTDNNNSKHNNVLENWAKIIYSLRSLALPSLLIITVLFLSTIAPPNSAAKSMLSIQSFQRLHRISQRNTTDVAAQDALDKALESASITNYGSIRMNKTVIIAVVNKAYVEGELPNMLDLFLEGLWIGQGTRSLLPHILIVAVDETSYERCVFRGLNCYRLNATAADGGGGGGEAVFMSKGFISMMWSRTRFLLDVLQRGYSFIFTDTDVMWLRNPFTVLLHANQTEDIQFSTDVYNGDPTSESNLINTGFYHVRSNNKTVALFSKWYGLKDNSTGLKEQDVLQNLTRRGFLRELNLTAEFLETRFFSGFCSDSRDFNAVVTVHANCCRYISAKLADLKRVLADWKRYRTTPANETRGLRWSPHVGCWSSWRPRRNEKPHGNKNATTATTTTAAAKMTH